MLTIRQWENLPVDIDACTTYAPSKFLESFMFITLGKQGHMLYVPTVFHRNVELFYTKYIVFGKKPVVWSSLITTVGPDSPVSTFGKRTTASTTRRHGSRRLGYEDPWTNAVSDLIPASRIHLDKLGLLLFARVPLSCLYS